MGSHLSNTSYYTKLQRSALRGASIDPTSYVHTVHVLVVLSTAQDYKVNCTDGMASTGMLFQLDLHF